MKKINLHGQLLLYILYISDGFLLCLVQILLLEKLRNNKNVSHSSAEAKNCAMSVITRELLWFLQPRDFGIQLYLIPLHCDKQAAQHIAANQVFHERTKHIKVHCHIVHEWF